MRSREWFALPDGVRLDPYRYSSTERPREGSQSRRRGKPVPKARLVRRPPTQRRQRIWGQRPR